MRVRHRIRHNSHNAPAILSCRRPYFNRDFAGITLFTIPSRWFLRVSHGSRVRLPALDPLSLHHLSQEDAVQRSSSTDWPIWHDDPWHEDPWHDPTWRGAVAPQRHDIALARYLEKQQACRGSAVRRLDLSAAMTHASVLIAHVGGAILQRLRPLQRSIGPAGKP